MFLWGFSEKAVDDYHNRKLDTLEIIKHQKKQGYIYFLKKKKKINIWEKTSEVEKSTQRRKRVRDGSETRSTENLFRATQNPTARDNPVIK